MDGPGQYGPVGMDRAGAAVPSSLSPSSDGGHRAGSAQPPPPCRPCLGATRIDFKLDRRVKPRALRSESFGDHCAFDSEFSVNHFSSWPCRSAGPVAIRARGTILRRSRFRPGRTVTSAFLAPSRSHVLARQVRLGARSTSESVLPDDTFIAGPSRPEPKIDSARVPARLPAPIPGGRALGLAHARAGSGRRTPGPSRVFLAVRTI